jgi:hypothetical protein
MTRKPFIRKRRGTSWNTESSLRANQARWSADRARREAEVSEQLSEMAEVAARNLPRAQGDAIGCLQWTDYRTGQVRRWVVRIGDRIDRMTFGSPGEQTTKSHGWTWFFTKLREKICKR